MSFSRARSETQKNIRLNEIKQAAIEIFDQQLFHEIQLTKIAEKTDFSRANLYKYVSTKEEIYLLVTIDEVNEWLIDLEKTLTKKPVNNLKRFSESWVEVTTKHSRFLKLVSLLYTTMEQNVSMEALVTFKRNFVVSINNLRVLLKAWFPKMTEADMEKFTRRQLAYMIGSYPIFTMTNKQKKAIEQIGVHEEVRDFSSDLYEFTYMLTDYLLNTDK